MAYFQYSGDYKMQKPMKPDQSDWGFNYRGMMKVQHDKPVPVLNIKVKEPSLKKQQKEMEKEAMEADAQIAVDGRMNRGLDVLSSQQRNEIHKQRLMDNWTVNYGANQYGLFQAGLRRRDYERASKASSVKT